MTPLQAIKAATSMGPQTLGPQAPKSGILKASYNANIIAVAKSPLPDVSILADTSNVIHVWKVGNLVKQLAKD